MTQDEIIEIARQAGFETQLRKGKILGFDRDGDYTEELEAFTKLVAAKEREACADIVGIALLGSDRELTKRVATAIRTRGKA